MNDSLQFSWGGELDNGFTVDLNFKLDNGDGTAAKVLDNRTLAIGMGDTGTLTFHGSAGSGVVGSFDDKMPTAYEESWYSADSPNQGHSAANMWYYTNALEGATIHASFTPAGNEASTELGVVVNAFENLEIGAAFGDDNANIAVVENTIMYAKYTIGGATIGVQANEADSETVDADEEFTAASISYAVSEDVSVSYGMSEIAYEAIGTANQEATGFSASYTMGSMTLAGTVNSITNQGAGATGAGNTRGTNDTYEINLSFAF
jgi:outer membrane protein OmpU